MPDALARPPRDARVSVDADAVTIRVSPWLVDRGRHDTAVLGFFGALLSSRALLSGQGGIAAVVAAAVLILVNLFLGTGAACLLFGCGLIAALVALVVVGRRDEERLNQELDLVVSRHELKLVWRQDAGVFREQKVALRDIGRVDAEPVGYQRKHVVAHVVGRELLVIPVERESDEVADWLAGVLAALGRHAREQGGTMTEIPSELRALLED